MTLKETSLSSSHLPTEAKSRASFVQLESHPERRVKKVNLKVTAAEHTRNPKFRGSYVNNQT